MKKYYIAFIPNRHLDGSGELIEKIYFSYDDALNGVTKHYRDLYESEIEYCLKIPKSKFISMCNDEDCTFEPTTYKKFIKWVDHDPKSLEDIFEFYSDMNEELDMLWRLNYDSVLTDAFEIVSLEPNGT